MSDNEVRAENVPSFKVTQVLVHQKTGDLMARGTPFALPSKVYDRAGAIRFAVYEARKATPVEGETRWIVTSPGGRCVAVLSGTNGKPVPTAVALKTRRELARASKAPGEPRRRRTSRVPGQESVARPARRTSRSLPKRKSK